MIILALILAVAGAGPAGCGGESPAPDPHQVMDRALERQTLDRSLATARITVESLGYRDRVLEKRELEVPPRALAQLRRGLADSGDGFREIVTGLSYGGGSGRDGEETYRISGRVDPEALVRAAERAGAAGSLRAGMSAVALSRNLVGARFDLYAGQSDGALRQLDLTLSLDDPDNALPPTRIRFSLTGESPGTT